MQPTTDLAPHRVMAWLADGLPLSLLMDLFVAERLDSSELLRHEGATVGTLRIPQWPHPAA